MLNWLPIFLRYYPSFFWLSFSSWTLGSHCLWHQMKGWELVSQGGFVSICSLSTMPSRMTNPQGNWILQLGSLHALFRFCLQRGYLTKSQEKTNSVPHSQSHVPCYKVVFICIDRSSFLIYSQVTDATLTVFLCGCSSSKWTHFSCNRNSGLAVILDIQWWTFEVNLSSLSFYRQRQACPSVFMASCTYMLIVYRSQNIILSSAFASLELRTVITLKTSQGCPRTKHFRMRDYHWVKSGWFTLLF